MKFNTDSLQLKFIFRSVLLFILFAPVFSWAQYFRAAPAQALGGAGRANYGTASNYFLNPALLVYAPSSVASFYYQDGYYAKRSHSTVMGLGFIENKSRLLFSGAMSYLKSRYTRFDGESFGSPVEEEYVDANFAKRITSSFSLGFNVYRLTQNPSIGVTDQYLGGGVGGHWLVSPNLSFALVYQDLIQRDEDEAEPFLHRPRRLSAGVTWNLEGIATLNIDGLRIQPLDWQEEQDEETDYSVGLERVFRQYFVFRGGYEWQNSQDREFYSVGAAFRGPRLRLQYYFRKQDGAKNSDLHGIDMVLPF